MKIADRVDACKEFKLNPQVTVILVSLRSGCVGLNLTSANRVILMDVWWNPAVENQAIDRVHRIGQKADMVHVTRITIPNTIEDRIMRLQEAKQDLTNEALMEGSGHSQQRTQRLSRRELMFLFRGH